MLHKILTNRALIIILLLFQPLPILLNPPSLYNIKSQEWWLAVLLVAMDIFAVVQILRGSTSVGPWDLVGFAHGFNIISRVMMLFPHITIVVNKQHQFNTVYASLTVLSIIFSWFFLWFIEQPEVRLVMLRKMA